MRRFSPALALTCITLTFGCGVTESTSGSNGDDSSDTSSGTAATASGTETGTTDSDSGDGDGDGDGTTGDGTTGDGDGDGDGDGTTGDGDGDGTTGDGDGDGATCPGTQTGCVIDFVGAFNTPGTADGVGTAARFGFIGGITSAGGNLYVASDHAIRQVEISTATVTTLAGTPGVQGYANGAGASAQLDGTVGVATDGTTLWFSDAGNSMIRQVDLGTGVVSDLIGQQGNSGSADGIANATFENMRDLAYDGTYLYLVQANGVIRRVDPSDGNTITLCGMPGQNGFVDGTGTAVRLSAPRFIEPVSPGVLYVSDTENHRPRLLTVSGGVGTMSSPYGGTQGYMDSMGTAAQFDRQRGLAHDDINILAVADSDNYVVRAVDLTTDIVTTIAGTAGVVSHAEGLGPAAQFDKPLDMHFDPGTGDLFISEGNVIRRMYWQ